MSDDDSNLAKTQKRKKEAETVAVWSNYLDHPSCFPEALRHIGKLNQISSAAFRSLNLGSIVIQAAQLWSLGVLGYYDAMKIYQIEYKGGPKI